MKFFSLKQGLFYVKFKENVRELADSALLPDHRQLVETPRPTLNNEPEFELVRPSDGNAVKRCILMKECRVTRIKLLKNSLLSTMRFIQKLLRSCIAQLNYRVLKANPLLVQDLSVVSSWASIMRSTWRFIGFKLNTSGASIEFLAPKLIHP